MLTRRKQEPSGAFECYTLVVWSECPPFARLKDARSAACAGIFDENLDMTRHTGAQDSV